MRILAALALAASAALPTAALAQDGPEPLFTPEDESPTTQPAEEEPSELILGWANVQVLTCIDDPQDAPSAPGTQPPPARNCPTAQPAEEEPSERILGLANEQELSCIDYLPNRELVQPSRAFRLTCFGSTASSTFTAPPDTEKIHCMRDVLMGFAGAEAWTCLDQIGGPALGGNPLFVPDESREALLQMMTAMVTTTTEPSTAPTASGALSGSLEFYWAGDVYPDLLGESFSYPADRLESAQ